MQGLCLTIFYLPQQFTFHCNIQSHFLSSSHCATTSSTMLLSVFQQHRFPRCFNLPVCLFLFHSAALTNPVCHLAWIGLIKSRGLNTVMNFKECRDACTHTSQKTYTSLVLPTKRLIVISWYSCSARHRSNKKKKKKLNLIFFSSPMFISRHVNHRI